MPVNRRYAKRRTSRRPRRARRRRGGGAGYRNPVARQIQPSIPRPLATQLVKMTYKNILQITPTIIAGVMPFLGFTFCMNRISHMLDTQVMVGNPSEIWLQAPTASGDQMPHLANWAGLYNRYLVRGSKISVTYRTNGTSSSTDKSAKLVLVRHSDPNTVTQTTTWQNLNQTAQNFKAANITPTTSGLNQASLSMGYSPSRRQAINKSALTAERDLQGDLSAATYVKPVVTDYITAGMISPYQAATTGAHNYPAGLLEVRVDMLVQFLDPKQNTLQQPLMMPGAQANTPSML